MSGVFMILKTVLAADFEAIISFYKENGYRFARIAEAQNYVKKFEDGVYLGFEIDEGYHRKNYGVR